MSDPSTGQQPEQGPEESQSEQPTRSFGPSEHPTMPIGSTWPAPYAKAPGSAEEPPPVVEANQGMPLGTFVFGLVVMAVGLLILVSVLCNVTLSGSTVAIILFLGAGLVLIVGGLVAARRSSRTNPSRS